MILVLGMTSHFNIFNAQSAPLRGIAATPIVYLYLGLLREIQATINSELIVPPRATSCTCVPAVPFTSLYDTFWPKKKASDHLPANKQQGTTHGSALGSTDHLSSH